MLTNRGALFRSCRLYTIYIYIYILKSDLPLFPRPSALGEGLDCFVQCPPEALSWSRRKYLILEEILTYRPHILCLQEVDHYHDTFQPVLEGLGYSGSFCPKPWSPCLQVEGNNGPDGCALFFDRSRYECLDSVNLKLSALRIPTNQVEWTPTADTWWWWWGRLLISTPNTLLSRHRLPW